MLEDEKTLFHLAHSPIFVLTEDVVVGRARASRGEFMNPNASTAGLAVHHPCNPCPQQQFVALN